MTSIFERVEDAIGVSLKLDARWGGHGEPKIWIFAKGYIEGIAENEDAALQDFMWRNNIILED